MDRSAALPDLRSAALAFDRAALRVPPAALGHRSAETDDYTLGGLVPHVAGAVIFYAETLEAIVAAAFAPVAMPKTPMSERRDALARTVLTPEVYDAERAALRVAVERLERGLAAVRETDWERAVAAVTYPDATQPYPTRADDLRAWVADHCREHAEQIERLLADWAVQVSCPPY